MLTRRYESNNSKFQKYKNLDFCWITQRIYG